VNPDFWYGIPGAGGGLGHRCRAGPSGARTAWYAVTIQLWNCSVDNEPGREVGGSVQGCVRNDWPGLLLDQIAFLDARIAQLSARAGQVAAAMPAAWGIDPDGTTGPGAGTGPGAPVLPAVARLPGISASRAAAEQVATGHLSRQADDANAPGEAALLTSASLYHVVRAMSSNTWLRVLGMD
jgi:hypothetical protein